MTCDNCHQPTSKRIRLNGKLVCKACKTLLQDAEFAELADFITKRKER